MTQASSTSSPGMVSIVIPAYNREHLIGQTLDSIKAQTYTNWECIVVDDGSLDNTLKIVEGYVAADDRFKVYKRPSDLFKGANNCRNFGFTKAVGEFIIWFDSDDIMLPQDLYQRMAVSKGMDAIITLGRTVDEQLNSISDFRRSDEPNLYRNYAYTGTEMITNSVMFRKQLLAGEKLFDPEIVRGQEADFFLRIFRKITEDRFVILNEVGFLYRQHSGTKTTADTAYRKDYKMSQQRIYLENLDYALRIKDHQLAGYMYKQLVPIIFMAAKHRDSKTLHAARSGLFKLLGKKNFWWKSYLRWSTHILYILGRSSYGMEKKMRNAKLNFDR